jgi:hypothetical protein
MLGNNIKKISADILGALSVVNVLKKKCPYLILYTPTEMEMMATKDRANTTDTETGS